MLTTGQKTVTTAGTRVVLGTGVVNSAIIIKAASTNTGLVYLGDSTVSSTTGFILSANEVLVIENVGDISKIYIDASVNSQKVSWVSVDGV